MLAGRREERQAIDALVAGARLGRSGVLVVHGEPGIGKTTLLGTPRTTPRACSSSGPSGSEQEQNVAFAGLHQLLSLVLSTLARLPAAHGDTLAVALGLREGQVGGRFAVGVALLDLLTHLADESSLLVAVDDAHLWTARAPRPSASSDVGCSSTGSLWSSPHATRRRRCWRPAWTR